MMRLYDMQLTISSVDYAPTELHDQVPIVLNLIREIPGDDRPDYWLGVLQKPVFWNVENQTRDITHLVVAARWQGTSIATGIEHLPIGIAYVVDNSILDDQHLRFEKCKYIAIGLASETSGGAKVQPLDRILGGRIGKNFGLGGKSKRSK